MNDPLDLNVDSMDPEYGKSEFQRWARDEIVKPISDKLIETMGVSMGDYLEKRCVNLFCSLALETSREEVELAWQPSLVCKALRGGIWLKRYPFDLGVHALFNATNIRVAHAILLGAAKERERRKAGFTFAERL